MARYSGPVCKLCRREGMKLFLKGFKCYTAKCIYERRSFAPGVHGKRRTKLSPYGEQLREKQKLRRMYGILEKQFRIMFHKASRQKGITGENLLRLLELRLDNIVFRAGFAPARAASRMFVTHGHVTVNGKKVNIPSYQLRVSDVIEIKNNEKSRKLAQEALKMTESRLVPEWLKTDKENFKVQILDVPSREQMDIPINEQLIVELYSK
ncbi:30S ribosomal protein S4 [bacterium]|nr:30S ribosomal protein S4 [bacterium]